MESIPQTKAATILEFFAGLRGTLPVTFREGTWAAWLYDLLKPRVANLVVCNPRKNALVKRGNKSDRIDARKLALVDSLAAKRSLDKLVNAGCDRDTMVQWLQLLARPVKHRGDWYYPEWLSRPTRLAVLRTI